MDEQRVNFLGIHLDSKLSWDEHIDYLCTRLSRVIFLIRNLKTILPASYLRNVYFAFFHSLITYGIIFWGNCCGVAKILILQKKIIRILTGLEINAHCKLSFKNLKIMTVVNLYIFEQILYIRNHLYIYEERTAVHLYPTRNSHLLQLPQIRLHKT